MADPALARLRLARRIEVRQQLGAEPGATFERPAELKGLLELVVDDELETRELLR